MGNPKPSSHRKAVINKVSHVGVSCVQIAQRINYAPSTMTHLLHHGLLETMTIQRVLVNPPNQNHGKTKHWKSST